MSGQVKTMVRVLRSAGSITLANGNLVLLSLESGRLVEKIYDGDDLKDQRKVADGVKNGSSAVYAASENNVFVLYINNSNQIKASEFDPDSEEWDDTNLAGLSTVATHHAGHLAIASIHGSNLVFYQGTDGVIKTIRYEHESNKWAEQFSIPGAAAAGTPISAYSTDKALVVSFIGGDNTVHVHSRDFESGKWTDDVLPSSSWNEAVTSLVVSQDSTTGALEAFALVNTTVDHVKKDGTRAALGSIKNGEFVPATKAEAGDVFGNNYGIIYNNFGMGGGCCGGYRPPPVYYSCRPCW
ncbi:hypothetical protein QQS21_010923 [Conoideocrella luteorostrata]|uniref:Fucose-specific lectin n=1 Tax=Conoideocrella luteorostrata TaxID=1105319 RepID=A0AAJ0CGT8_9HYPO|nr:hypothetical protein QQS21_010923 [Conoideocrella luteorostrata]